LEKETINAFSWGPALRKELGVNMGDTTQAEEKQKKKKESKKLPGEEKIKMKKNKRRST